MSESQMTPVSNPDVTLVEGSTFCISATDGEMAADRVDGLYYRDTRIVSSWRVVLDGRAPEPLAVQPGSPYEATFVGRRRGDGAPLLIERHRLVGDGMREDLVLRNLGSEDTACRLTIEVGTDFADMFSVKAGSPKPLGSVSWSAYDEDLLAEARAIDGQRGIRVRLEGGRGVGPGLLAVDVVIPARGSWQSSVQVFPIVDEEEHAPAYRRGEPVQDSRPATRFRKWRYAAPQIEADEKLSVVLDRSVQDLGALRVRRGGPDDAAAEVVAAGVPWFMTLFGRDSLLTAWMTLPIDQELALSTLTALAELQGRRVDPLNEEEPGRILHEVRHGTAFPLSPGNAVYYGTADATPLFCMLVGELHRWGTPKERLAPLLPYVDRALEWILRYGDRDGDGFVEYKRATDRGLFNQGWKDSHDSVTFPDGRIAEPPIALAEVQAYVYGAFVARSELASAFGDDAAADQWRERALRFKARFHEAFWLPGKGYLAMALDRDKRPVDVLASNMGHCLWTGLAEPDVAARVAERLMSPELFSGWGIRTLASTMAAYDPISYHNGSVWPHDSAICAAGLARYGYTEEAARVVDGLLAAATSFGGRLPELFCGFDRSEFILPVPYPTSCSPQAWAAAAPLLLLRSLLRLDPDVPARTVRAAERLPAGFGPISIRHLRLGEHVVTINADDRGVDMTGLGDLRLLQDPVPSHSGVPLTSPR
jgi:glycogen debranching enzyme